MSFDMPKVSVILPVYNVSEYLHTSLSSLTNQTLQEIEIICINDGSTDNSLEIIKEFAEKDSRIVVVDKKNEGQGIARNLGITMAKGEYIGFVDPDDWVKPDMYEKMYNQAKNLSSDIVICDLSKYIEAEDRYTKFNFFKEAISPFITKDIKVKPGEILDRELINKTLLVSPCYSWNKIYKSDMIKNNEVFFSDSRCFQDCIFVLKSHFIAEKISYIDEELYIYRIRRTSTLRSLSTKSKGSLRTIFDLKNFLQEQGKLDEFYYNLEWFMVMNAIYHYKDFTQKDKKEHLRVLSTLLEKETFETLKHRICPHKNVLENIFSVKNTPNRKIVTILGLKIKFKNTPKNLDDFLREFEEKQQKYEKDCYVLYDCLYDDLAECIDAYSLFCYMKSKGIKAYYVLLRTSSLYKELLAENKLENIVVLEDKCSKNPAKTIEKIFDVLLRAKCVLTSFGSGSDKVDEFFANNKFIEYVFVQHGPTYIETRVIGGYISPTRYNKILVSSENEKEIFLRNGWSEDRLIKAGLPRWDLLNKSSNNEKSLLFMFTWRRLQGSRFEKSLYKKRILSLLNNEDLHNYLKSGGIKMYFAEHHALKNNSNIDFDISHPEISFIDSGKISEYIKKCSLLVTDFSSVSFDFMFQDKPVIFYPLDKDDKVLSYSEQVDIRCFCDMQSKLPNILFSENDVIEKIKYYVEREFEIESNVKENYRKFFYVKENIRQKIAEILEQFCNKEQV